MQTFRHAVTGQQETEEESFDTAKALMDAIERNLNDPEVDNFHVWKNGPKKPDEAQYPQRNRHERRRAAKLARKHRKD